MTGIEHEVQWAWLTVVLSGLVLLGYATISFNWYFQSKLRNKASSASLSRLRTIFFVCAVGGYIFITFDANWLWWRTYDIALFALVVYTWSHVVRQRGLSLVDERLAQVAELEKTAERYREIAELLPQMVWTANADGQIDFANQRWHDYTAGHRTWLDAVHPDERQKVTQWWGKTVAAARQESREVLLEGKVGYRTFLVSATPVIHGQAIKWLGACPTSRTRSCWRPRRSAGQAEAILAECIEPRSSRAAEQRRARPRRCSAFTSMTLRRYRGSRTSWKTRWRRGALSRGCSTSLASGFGRTTTSRRWRPVSCCCRSCGVSSR